MKIAIIGGGVAGIMTAVKLQTDGHEVTLFERHENLAVEASSEQHGWGQFGQLYSHIEDEGVALACFENIRTLKKHFDLPGNNLEFDEYGELQSKDSSNPSSWYRGDLLKYSYKDQPEEVFERILERKWKMHSQGLGSEIDLKKPIIHKTSSGEEIELDSKDLVTAKKGFRRLRQLIARKNPEGPIAREIARDEALGMNHYTTVNSHDRPMRSINILNSAIDKFKELGGTIQINTEITDFQSNDDGVTLVDKVGKTQYFEKAVFTAGIGLEQLTSETFCVNTVISPLLVVSPAISNQNFVKLSSDRNATINHISHIEPSTGKTYSLIGNGDAANPNDKTAIEFARENIVATAKRTFPELESDQFNKTVYFGYKTEFQQSNAPKARNYHYATAALDTHGNVIAAVPGKFTLAPSLAVKISEDFTPATPSEKILPIKPVDNTANVSAHLHHQIVKENVENPAFRAKRNKMHLPKVAKSPVSFFNTIGNSQNMKPNLPGDKKVSAVIEDPLSDAIKSTGPS